MWFSDFSIRKPVITVVMMLALVVFGLVSLLVLDTDEFPKVDPPVVNVSIPYPGASPEVVERELIDPLEEAFQAISGVDEIESTATDGFGVITVMFDFSKDLQEASQDVRDKISATRADLPVEMEEPIITRFSTSDFPIVSLTLTSPRLSPAELTRIADPGITSALRGVSGVADVRLVGGRERELTVALSPDALQAAGVGVADVAAALQTQNLAVPVGRLDDRGLAERTIRLRGRLETPEQFAQVVVRRSGTHIIRLGDVAAVTDGSEDPRTTALYNDSPAVGIDILKSTDDSTTKVSDRIRATITRLQRTLPEGATLQIVRDSGVRVDQSVTDVQHSLLEGALLTVLVVFLFLNSWRSTVITGLALPVSVLASFIAVWAFGFTLNTMSLLGLSLAIGILVDDAIVVRENIVRHVEMGKDHLTAAREGTAEIGLAVAATTFSIVVVFVPIAFMGGIAQQWFAPFALTIACSVLVSLFVSFSLDPMLSAHWPDPKPDPNEKRSFITRGVTRFNSWFDAQTDRYKRVIGWALRHRLAMVIIAIGAFAGALAIPAVGLVGGGFFPEQDRSELNVKIEAPAGSGLEYTRFKALDVTRLARALPEVAYTYTGIGGSSGGGGLVTDADVYVRLVPRAERDRSQQEIEAVLRAEVKRIVGANVYISGGGMGGPGKQIQVQLKGPDARVLEKLAAQAEQLARKVPGAVDVGLSTRGARPEMEVVVDRDLAAAVGLDVGQVAQALRPAFAGLEVGDWIDPGGEARKVMVRFSPEARVNRADLERVPLVVTSANGSTIVPLGQVARIQPATGPNQVDHLATERVITVGANVEGQPLSAVVQQLDEQLAGLNLPAGYTLEQGGETEDQEEVFGRVLAALGVAVLLMYLVLVVQFGSFLDPIPVMASLPLSLIGVMLALLVTGSTLNIMSMIGVILLMGIVAKNAILLIDFAKWSEEKGMDRRQAIIEAGGVRLRPILMTSVAIIAGMLPVAIGWGEGGDFRAPLGRAVIGGVLTSTFLTLLVIPTFYDILAGWRAALGKRLRRLAHRHDKSTGQIDRVPSATASASPSTSPSSRT